MPNCGHLADYSIEVEQSQYKVSIDTRGLVDICKLVKRAFPEAKCEMLEERTFLLGRQIITVSGSHLNQSKLEQFLKLLKNCLTIDIDLDECHALSPHTLVNKDGNFFRSEVGELVYRAKNRSNLTAANKIAALLVKIITAHPRYAKSEFIVAAPRSEREADIDLPGYLAKHIVSHLGKKLLVVEKIRDTKPNKDLLQFGDVDLLRENVHNSMTIEMPITSSSTLALDDLCGSGMTLEELGRACRAAGATEVLGIVVTKDATMMQGGINLSEGPWHEQ